MKSNFKLGIVLLLAVLVITALIQASQKENIDWRRTYNPKDKIPYGTFVLKKELKTILGARTKITAVQESLYTFLETNKTQKKEAIVFVGDVFSNGKAANQKIMEFVQNGGVLFAAANEFESDFLDSLGIGYTAINEYKAGLSLKEKQSRLYLSKNRQEAVFDKLQIPKLFDELPSKDVTILGFVKKENLSLPNFIRINMGKGSLLLHLEPDVFTNYYLLQEKTFPIAAESLQYLRGKDIIWFDGLYDLEKEQTPLRFILSDRALKSAWYLLLLALILYLVFKSKREQRAVPIIEPEPNLSVDFAKTIGSLYYENGHPGNMILKKVEYFLFDLRKTYHVDTNDLSDKKMINSLSQRTGIPKEEVIQFMEQIRSIKEQGNLENLKNTYHLIEQFKLKANMP